MENYLRNLAKADELIWQELASKWDEIVTSGIVF